MNKIKSILFVLATALLCMSCVKDLEVTVEFNAPSYEISVGDTLNFASELKVENTVEVPTFSTSDEAVAKFVSETVLMALEPGDVEITATVAGKSAKTQVHINVVLADKILLEAPDSVLAASEEWAKVLAKVEPSNYNNENLVWEFTPSSDSLGLTYDKVSANEYSFKVAAYQEGAQVVVKVSDKNSEVSQTATINVIKPESPDTPEIPENPDTTQVAAKILRITAPDIITESDKTWGTVIVEVVADGTGEYNYENLVWEFTPSDAEATGFAYEKVTDSQYNVRFTAYKEGANVVIKVTDKVGGRYATKTIAVEQKPAEGLTSIEVTPKTLSLFVGKSANLTVKCAPSSYDPSLLVWETSDAKVATVNAGVVTAVAEGTAKVKVTDSVSGLSSECDVTVSVPVSDAEVEVKRIVLDVASLTLTAGEESYQLVATCYDENGNVVKDYDGLVWSALEGTNEDGNFVVVEVSDQGLVTPKAAGTTIVTVAVESNRSIKATCNVQVKAKVFQVEKMTLTPADKTIDKGQSFTLEVKTVPDLSIVDDKTITFVSNNPEVATVSESGYVTAIEYGEAEITATAASGVTATAKVIVAPVTGEEEEVTDFEINLTIENEPSDENMALPQFEKLQVKFAYTNGYVAKDTRWEVSDPTLVKVTEYNGYIEVEAIYDGMMTNEEKKPVTITHYAGIQTASKTIDITRALPKSVRFAELPENNTLYLGDSFTFDVIVSPAQASQEVSFTGDFWFKEASWQGNTVTVRKAGTNLSFSATATGTTISTGTIYLNVIPRPVEGGVLSNSTLELEEGRDATLEIDFTPAHNENYDYNVVWESSNTDVATVENGKVTAVAEGTATVTATLSNGEKLTCEVTVAAPVEAAVFVGDYYYSDGTWSTELDPSKTVIGVVFSVDNPTQMGDSQLTKDKPKATHGLVVALEETANIQWQASSTNVGAWLEQNNAYYDLKDTGRKCGYSNTIGLKAYNASCNAENKVLVADCAPNIALGSETSGWYLPSYAELDMLFKYEQSTRSSVISNGAIAQKIVAAGGTPFSIERSSYNTPDGMDDAPTYWSSTESSGSSIWATGVHFLYGGVTNKSKAGKTYYIARYIFAF